MAGAVAGRSLATRRLLKIGSRPPPLMQPFKRRARLTLAATIHWFASQQVDADTARFVVIQCPPEVEREATAELTDIRKRGEEATMAAVLKREGVRTLVDSTMPDPWRGEPVSVQGLAGDDLPVQPEMDGKNVIIEVEGFRGKDFARRPWPPVVDRLGRALCRASRGEGAAGGLPPPGSASEPGVVTRPCLEAPAAIPGPGEPGDDQVSRGRPHAGRQADPGELPRVLTGLRAGRGGS